MHAPLSTANVLLFLFLRKRFSWQAYMHMCLLDKLRANLSQEIKMGRVFAKRTLKLR